MRKQILTACLAVLAFASCTTDSDKDNDTIAKQILGKWMLTRMDGNIVPTNAKVVYTFESVTSGYISASRADFDGELTRWTDHAPSEVSINGRMVNMSGTLSKSTSFTADIEITDINDRETQSKTDYTVYHNGDTMYTSKGATLWTKVDKDYSTDILGVWEGRVTNTEGSEYDDGELHRWEYLADGSYIYYHLDADSNWLYAYGGRKGGPMFLKRFRLPSIASREVHLTDTDVLCTIPVNCVTVAQGSKIHNGHAYLPDGDRPGHFWLHILDLATGQEIHTIDLNPIGLEPEGIDVSDGWIYISFHTPLPGDNKIYRFPDPVK